jgi:1-acyl-sn-glycerol-3-phosphate acyltransferase
VSEARVREISLVNHLLCSLAKTALRVVGWHIEGTVPDIPKLVAIGAPHTSYWDLPLFLTATAVMSDGFATIKLAWIGKHTLFRGPLDALFRRLGGIPVNRAAGHHVIKAAIRAFQEHDRLVLVLAPEGTTKKVDYWKPGFYFIARLAHVPIVCGYLDYKRKVAGVGPTITPSGDMEADMKIMRDFYQHVTPKHPERAAQVRLERSSS